MLRVLGHVFPFRKTGALLKKPAGPLLNRAALPGVESTVRFDQRQYPVLLWTKLAFNIECDVLFRDTTDLLC